MIQRLAQVLGWLAVSTIIVLSLLPGDYRPHTGAPGNSEHIAAYLITAVLLAIGYQSPRSSTTIIIGLVALAGAMEICQFFIVGRHPGFDDFFASTLGAIVGVAVAWTGRARKSATLG